MRLTAIVRKGEKQFVALCPELDVVSQGYEVEEALANLKEALELHIGCVGLPEGFGDEDLIIASIEVSDDKTSTIVR